MRFWLRQVVVEYFKQKWVLFLFVTLFFCVGVFFGSTAAKTISMDRAYQLSTYFNSFLEKVAAAPVSEQLYFRHNVLNNLYIMIAIFVLGLTVIGIPLVLVAVFSRGFILGFTIGFLVREKALKGFLFALISVLPHNVFIIPAVIIGGVTALSFSGFLLKRRFNSPNRSLTGHLGVYTAVMLILCLVTTAAGFVETYVTPALIKSAAAWVR